MRHWYPKVLRRFAGKRDDLRQLLGRERRRNTAALLVGDHVQQHSLQLFVRYLRGRRRGQPLRRRRESPPPAIHPLPVDSQRGSLVHAALAVGRPKNYLNPFRQSPLQLPGTPKPLENLSLTRLQDDGAGRLGHRSSLILSLATHKR